MHAVRYDSYGGGVAGLKVIQISQRFLVIMNDLFIYSELWFS